jgi:hypothetical protein
LFEYMARGAISRVQRDATELLAANPPLGNTPALQPDDAGAQLEADEAKLERICEALERERGGALRHSTLDALRT